MYIDNYMISCMSKQLTPGPFWSIHRTESERRQILLMMAAILDEPGGVYNDVANRGNEIFA